MPQYDIRFAAKLAQVARSVLEQEANETDARRTVLYLSLLSTEIALKAMLERAGRKVAHIRSRSHNLAALLSDVDQCSVQVKITSGTKHKVPASRLRAVTLLEGAAVTTVGAVLDATSTMTSQYPNEVRYGERLYHYPPAVMIQLAEALVGFAKSHWDDLST